RKAPVVIYAALSDKDIDETVPEQLDECRVFVTERTHRNEDGEIENWFIAAEFHESGESAYSGNRGPELQKALTDSADLAAEYGRTILLTPTSTRLARGDGRKARHLNQLYWETDDLGVEIWTVRKRRRLTLEDSVLEGERAHDESEDKGFN